MKRTLIGIVAVLYLAACWAPQLWTASADAQEKAAPKVLEEVRARRFVLVDGVGEPRATLGTDEHGHPHLRLLGDDGAEARLGVGATGTPGLILSDPASGDAPSRLLLIMAGSAYWNAGSSAVSITVDGDPKAGPSVKMTRNSERVAVLKSSEFGTDLSFYDSDGVEMVGIGSLPRGMGGYVSLRGRRRLDAAPINHVFICSSEIVGDVRPADTSEYFEELGRGVVRPELKLSFGDDPCISITSAESEKETGRSLLDASRLDVRSGGQTRAQVGRVETVNTRTGAETTQEGVFVSYDADGNVLWMEPK